jgi:hypothetical protein
VGQSSGAWASLWLQIAYPDFFGGAWVTAPDPVDFRSFVGDTDIYQPNANVFADSDGRARSQAVARGQQLLTVKEFSDAERVVVDGEQLGAWESVFSRRGADGSPERLFDRTTGRVNAAVAETWKQYDLRLMLESGWPALGPRLAGKLHVYVSTEDTFLLDRPLRRLAESLAALKSDAVSRVPGRPQSLLGGGQRSRAHPHQRRHGQDAAAGVPEPGEAEEALNALSGCAKANRKKPRFFLALADITGGTAHPAGSGDAIGAVWKRLIVCTVGRSAHEQSRSSRDVRSDHDGGAQADPGRR